MLQTVQRSNHRLTTGRTEKPTENAVTVCLSDLFFSPEAMIKLSHFLLCVTAALGFHIPNTGLNGRGFLPKLFSSSCAIARKSSGVCFSHRRRFTVLHSLKCSSSSQSVSEEDLVQITSEAAGNGKHISPFVPTHHDNNQAWNTAIGKKSKRCSDICLVYGSISMQYKNTCENYTTNSLNTWFFKRHPSCPAGAQLSPACYLRSHVHFVFCVIVLGFSTDVSVSLATAERLAKMGIKSLTAVQARSYASIREGRDVIARCAMWSICA